MFLVGEALITGNLTSKDAEMTVEKLDWRSRKRLISIPFKTLKWIFFGIFCLVGGISAIAFLEYKNENISLIHCCRNISVKDPDRTDWQAPFFYGSQLVDFFLDFAIIITFANQYHKQKTIIMFRIFICSYVFWLVPWICNLLLWLHVICSSNNPLYKHQHVIDWLKHHRFKQK